MGDSSSKSPPSRLPADRKPRRHKRKLLLANVTFEHNGRLIVGICRDISEGGMMVLTGSSPGEPDTQVRVKIQPHASTGMAEFEATGRVVNLLPRNLGFCFQFLDLEENDRAAIAEFVRRSKTRGA